MTITKYVCGRDWEPPYVQELTFEEQGDLLVAPIGHRKKARYYLGGHYFTHKSDSTLSDTRNEAIDKVVAHLRAKIKPTRDRIAELLAMRIGVGVDMTEYNERLEEHNQAMFDWQKRQDAESARVAGVAVHDLERASNAHAETP
jgi:hypothetical protein